MVGLRSDVDRSRRAGDDAKLARPSGNHVTRMQLAPAPALALAVDEYLLVGQEGSGLTAVVDEPGQLEELAEPDGVAADRHVGGHG